MTAHSRVINVNVTFKNTEPTDALKNYAADKIKHCLQKFAHSDLEAHVVLRVEKKFQVAEVAVNCDGSTISGKEESDNLYAAIDALVGSLGQQLRKHKEKLTQHH
jgi:putative sigma-54 modulation protein